MRWDLFCRVIDNFGDVGVCWRLACDLAGRGEPVRLFIDDARALAWMAPQGAPGVQVLPFDAPAAPSEVVVEAFGCDPPPPFVAAMAAARPVWINLEYLSAEDWVERSHRLPSPQANGLTKWFFFPGFTPRTGGLAREPGLLAARDAFDRGAWLAAHGITLRPHERVVSLFCYDAAPVGRLLDALADRPTLLLAAGGRSVGAHGCLRTHALPWLAQRDYDRLLWASDLNFVRGEDSLVRAVWAARPFVWQAYPQDDGVHALKLQALLERMPPLPRLPELWRAWNSLQGDWPAWPDAAAWRHTAAGFAAAQAALPDLVTQLQAFAQRRAAGLLE